MNIAHKYTEHEVHAFYSGHAGPDGATNKAARIKYWFGRFFFLTRHVKFAPMRLKLGTRE